MDVADLRFVPRRGPQVARWLHDEWYARRGETLDEVRARVVRATSARRLPIMLLALSEGRAVGTVTLETESDPASGRPLLCLSNLYVDPASRGRGIGRRLCEAAVDRTRGLRIPRLSLFTASHLSYYERLGWSCVDLVCVPRRGGGDWVFQMRRPVDVDRRTASVGATHA